MSKFLVHAWPMKYLGHTYTKEFFIAYLKFKLS